MKYGVVLILLLSPCLARAVDPLVVDDADIVDFKQVEFISGWQFSRVDRQDLNTYYVNPNIGIIPDVEFGTQFGYQWLDSTPGVDGITDVAFDTKIGIWGKEDVTPFRLAVRFDADIPTASPRLGLGSGEPDADLFLIGTYTHKNSTLDWNMGYTKVNASRPVFNDDTWFVGQALTQQINDRWAVQAEAYAILPQGSASAPANLDYDAGPVYAITQNFLLTGVIGSGIGHNSPKLSTNFCFVWVF
jgi:hypothetical protein